MKTLFGRIEALVMATMVLVVLFAPSTGLAARSGCANEFSIDNGISCAAPKGTDTKRTLEGSAGIFVGIVDVIIYVVGALATLMIVIGGLRYVLSGGDAKGVESAKNSILYAVIGLVVAIGAYAVVRTVVNKFSAPPTPTPKPAQTSMITH